MNKKMRILWLCSWYPSKSNPYFARFTQRQAIATSLCCDVTVLYPVEHPVLRGIIIQNCTESFREFIVYTSPSKTRIIKMLRLSVAAWKGFKHISTAYGKPEIIQLSVIYPMGLAAFFLKVFYKLPLVIQEHWSGYRPADGSFKGIWLKSLAKACTMASKAIITISEGMAIDMMSHGLNGNYKVIPNAIDSVSPKVKIPLNKEFFRFIHASSLVDKEKNVSGILNSVEKLSKKRHNFSITIAGGLNDFEDLKIQVKRLNISQFVSFAGFLSRDELRTQMENADAFISFSNYEGGASNVVLEAMSVGTPVICTEIGGMHEWITPETGILIDIGDEDALVEAMSRMIDTVHLYDRQLISERVWERCSFEVVGRKFHDVYKEVLGR